MAPRRGGRSSSGGGGLPTCTSFAFEPLYPKIQLAFHALFFVIFGVLLCFSGLAFLRSRQKSAALRRWWALGVSIVFATLSVLLYIVKDVLTACEIDGSVETSLTASWIIGISDFLLLAAIVVPISKGILRAAQKTEKLVTSIFLPYVAILAILLVSAWSIDTYVSDSFNNDYRSPEERDKYKELVVHQTRLWTAISALMVPAVIMAAVAVAFAFFRGAKIPSRGIKISAPLAALSLLALKVTQLGIYVHQVYRLPSRSGYSSYEGISELQKLALIDIFLERFFFACAFLFAILSARSLDFVARGGEDAARQFGVYPVQYDDPQPSKFDSVSQQQPYQQNPPLYTNYQYPPPQAQYQQPPQATYP